MFVSPRDSIVFDTGHQSYVHKLVTGRQDFSTLRQQGGLSGYPERSESVHDIVELLPRLVVLVLGRRDFPGPGS